MTATDLALTVTEMLRKAKVSSGKFVEFYGPGTAAAGGGPRDHRQHGPGIRRDLGFFPVDGECCRLSPQDGPQRGAIALIRKLFHARRACSESEEAPESSIPTDLELDLATVEPSVAGPKRPQDRVG